MLEKGKKGKPEEIAIICPDGFVPQLTLYSMTDEEGNICCSIYGKGGKAHIMLLLSALIRTCLQTLNLNMVTDCMTIAVAQAVKDGIDIGLKPEEVEEASSLIEKIDDLFDSLKSAGENQDED